MRVYYSPCRGGRGWDGWVHCCPEISRWVPPEDQKAAPERDVSSFRAAIIRNGNGKSPQRALRGGTKGVTTESKENSLIPHNF